ncbi:MAG: hypothetical protein M9947_03320 [Thermomicrobiales bacterium]|nr:hypothetical protein [Thermomicrobiales bacterium]
MTSSPLISSDLLTRLIASKRRGVEFLLLHIGSDGTVADATGGRVTWYRFPWALAVSGETAAAFSVLSWIERTGLGPDGSFHGGMTWDPVANRTTNTYPETILSYGAVLLRRFDIARRAMDFADRYQDVESGGIFMTRERTGAGEPQLLFPTAQFGMSAVLTGRLETARRTGEWFVRLWDAQPELPDRLYTIWTSNGLLTDFPADIDPRHVAQESQKPLQLFYNGGIAASFLVQLSLATGESKWLHYARRYQQFSMDSCADQFETKQVCKSAWGSGLLYLATGDARYLPWIVRMGMWFADVQDADGGWSNTYALEPDPPLRHRLEITAEFVVHLDTVIAALGAAKAAGNAG